LGGPIGLKLGKVASDFDSKFGRIEATADGDILLTDKRSVADQEF